MRDSKRRAWHRNLDPANADPHVVFDLSLPMKERRQEAKVFASLAKAADYMGCAPTTAYKYRQPGKRWKAADGKEYAIRVAYGEFLDRLKK
jgi:hypothetical protein